MAKYGLPYQGSKQALADRILAKMPNGGTFYDLFAGGFSMTHAALLSKKFDKVVANELDGDMVELFRRAVAGEYRNESRWISREEFFRLKDVDPYVRLVWSFGNKGDSYMYSKEIEPFKRAVHNICFAPTPYGRKLAFRDLSKAYTDCENGKARLREYIAELCKECGVECVRREDGTPDVSAIKKPLYVALTGDVRKYLRDVLRESGLTAADVDKHLGNQMSGHYFGKSQWALPSEENYIKMQEILPLQTVPWAQLKQSLESLERLQSLQSLQSLESLQSLQSLQRLQSLESLESLQRLERLSLYSGDYADVDIDERDAVVYCDIPYANTAEYKCGGFDHARFYDWVEKLRCPVFISEYWMPEDRFECVAEFSHRSKLSLKNIKCVERLFCPKGNVQVMRDSGLFDCA